jgi:serine protease Do
MSLRTSTQELCRRFEVDYHPGVVVINVEPGSPADDRGIEPGFIVAEVNGEPVKTETEFKAALRQVSSRKPVSLLVRDLDSQPSYLALRLDR